MTADWSLNICEATSRPGAVFTSRTSLQRIKLLARTKPESTGPSFEEGWPRRSTECIATLESARPGRSDHCCNKRLTSPGCALFKVALHLFLARSRPSSMEGPFLSDDYSPIDTYIRTAMSKLQTAG